MQNFKGLARYLLSLVFVASGVNHFWHPVSYLLGMPSYLPWPLQLIYISGFFAVVLGLLLLVPRFSQLAAWGIIVWLIAVFPANVHMAANAALYPDIVAVVLWLRLPLQFLLILWAYQYTRPNAHGAHRF